MSKIVEFIPKDPVPLTSSGTDFVSDNGEMKVTLTTDTATNANVMEISRSGDDSGVKWYPRAVLYVGENNMRDIIFNANYSVGASVHRQTHARYSDHFANIDDRFAIEAGQIKHYFSINAEQRAPLAFLKNPRLGFAGIIEIDPTWQIVGMGEPIATKTECIGALSVQDANGIERFLLPKVTAWDQSGNTTDGTFIVAPLKAGRYEVIMCVPDAWLAQDSLVYPVVVDPTVVVASAYDVSGSGRKIVRLSNGWIVAVANNTSTDYPYWYVSKDNGQTWAQLCYGAKYAVNGAIAIASVGTTVYTVTNYNDTFGPVLYKFDATTVANASQNYLSRLDTFQTAMNTSMALAIDGTGALHAVWSNEISNYSSSVNIRYGKSTDGGATWTVTQITTANVSGVGYAYPCIAVQANNSPIIVAIYNDASTYSTVSWVYNGSSWAAMKTIYSSGSSTYPQYDPCVAVDGNGVIHVAWDGEDATYPSANNLRYSKSTDAGGTWSTPQLLTTATGSNAQINPTIAISPSDNSLHVLFAGVDPAVSAYYNIRKIVYSGGAWGAVTTLTSNTTGNDTHPQALWSDFNENSVDAVRYIWQDAQAVAVQYNSLTLNQQPNAPTLTAHAAFDVVTAQTFGWTFSDPNTGDTQSAYQIQFVDTSTGSTVLDSGKVASTSSAYVLAANALTDGKSYQWRVATWDAAGLQGPYSTYGTFNTSAPPSVTITSPATDGVTVGLNQLTVGWSYSDPYNYPQGQYQVQLTDSTGNTVLSDTGVVSDANARSRTVQYNLATGTNYKVKVTVWNNQGIASSVVTRAFLANYTSPVAPVAIVLPQAASAHNLVTADFPGPDPTTTQPDLASLDVYRRNTGDTSWQRIAAAITLGAKITFTRASAANNPNTLKPLGVNAPAYVPGKWSQALSIWEGTTQLVFNSDFETITSTATVFSDPLTSYTGSTAAPWTVQSGSFAFGASGATSAAVTSIIKAGNSAWKPLVGSGGQNLALTAQATFTQPSTLPVMNAHLTLEIDANNRYRVEINTTGTWLSLGKIVNGTYTDLTSQTITALSVSHAYTFTLSLDHTGLLTAKLYDGTGTGGTLLQTLTATDTSFTGGFLLGVGGDTGVVISGASVTAPWADGWSIGGDSRVAWALTGDSASGSYAICGVGISGLEGWSVLSNPPSLAGGNPYTLSAYTKALNGVSTGGLIYANTSTPSTTYTSIGSNYTRVSSSTGQQATTSNPYCGCYVENAGTYYFDAIQLEAKSYATSYLQNNSTSASATRAAETATLPSSLLNASEGTISVEVNVTPWNLSNTSLVFNSGIASPAKNRIYGDFFAGLARLVVYDASGNYKLYSGPLTVGVHRFTYTWANGAIGALYIDGVKQTTTSGTGTGVFALTSDPVSIGCSNFADDGNGFQINTWIDEPTIWNRALTDAEVLADANATGPLTWQDGMTYLGHLDGGLYGVSTYADYAVASGQSYDYKVTANGNNGVSADSAVANGSVTVPGLQVFDPTNPAGTVITIPMDVAQTSTWTASAEKLLFAGRTRPVVEFGETDEFTVKVSVIMTNADGLWSKLNALVRSKTTLCFKTPDGRKIFGAVLSLPEVDQLWGGQTVDLTIVETTYSEVV